MSGGTWHDILHESNCEGEDQITDSQSIKGWRPTKNAKMTLFLRRSGCAEVTWGSTSTTLIRYHVAKSVPRLLSSQTSPVWTGKSLRANTPMARIYWNCGREMTLSLPAYESFLGAGQESQVMVKWSSRLGCHLLFQWTDQCDHMLNMFNSKRSLMRSGHNHLLVTSCHPCLCTSVRTSYSNIY